MKEWSGTIVTTSYADLDLTQAAAYAPLDRQLLFDIETTGFSPKNCMCYMIGYCYMQDSLWHYRILFNEDGRSEYAMILEFLSILQEYEILIHYNGDQFDIPFLEEKIRQYLSLGLPIDQASELSRVQSLDLYKIIKPYRQGLMLPNLKLSTLEQSMGFTRSDAYNGGELISVYKQYLIDRSEEAEYHLYRHNYEDILAMIPMLQLLNYTAISSLIIDNCDIYDLPSSDNRYIAVEYPLPVTLPLPFQLQIRGVQIRYENSQGRILIPVLKAELFYYISNWKDYYYLPLEDTVIHKSVAEFVDSEFKEKAKKNNCYLKKYGDFIPISPDFKNSEYVSVHNITDTKRTEPLKVYQAAPQSKEYYMELDESLLKDYAFLNAYIQSFLT